VIKQTRKNKQSTKTQFKNQLSCWACRSILPSKGSKPFEGSCIYSYRSTVFFHPPRRVGERKKHQTKKAIKKIAFNV